MLDFLYDEEAYGEEGEDKICEILEKTVKGKILRNVYIPKDNNANERTEADIVFLWKKGIFVFESKYFGECMIFGKNYEKNWTVSYYGNKVTMYNPIKQNQNHIYNLSKYLGVPEKYFESLVVFSNTSDLSKLNIEGESVLNRRDLRNCLLFMERVMNDVMGETEIDSLYEKIKPLTEVSEKVKEDHVNRLNEKSGKTRRDNNGYAAEARKILQAMFGGSEEDIKKYQEEINKSADKNKKKHLLQREYDLKKTEIEQNLNELKIRFQNEKSTYFRKSMDESSKHFREHDIMYKEMNKKIKDIKDEQEKRRIINEYEQQKRVALIRLEEDKTMLKNAEKLMIERYESKISEEQKIVDDKKQKLKLEYQKKWNEMFHEKLPFWLE